MGGSTTADHVEKGGGGSWNVNKKKIMLFAVLRIALHPPAVSEHSHNDYLLNFYGVADPDPGSGAFLTLGSGMSKKSGSGSEMNNQDHISESLDHFYGLKYLNSLMRIRDGKNSDP